MSLCRVARGLCLYFRLCVEDSQFYDWPALERFCELVWTDLLADMCLTPAYIQLAHRSARELPRSDAMPYLRSSG